MLYHEPSTQAARALSSCAKIRGEAGRERPGKSRVLSGAIDAPYVCEAGLVPIKYPMTPTVCQAADVPSP